MFLNILGLFAMGVLGSFGSFFLKKATSNSRSILGVIKTWSFALGVIFYTSSATLSIILLRCMPYSIVIPAGALSYIWTLGISRVLLGEKINRWMICGILLIVLGVVMVGLSNSV